MAHSAKATNSMLGLLFELPNLQSVFSSSTEEVNTVWANISPLLVLLAIPIALIIFGLVIWGIKALITGAANAIVMNGSDPYKKAYRFGGEPEDWMTPSQYDRWLKS